MWSEQLPVRLNMAVLEGWCNTACEASFGQSYDLCCTCVALVIMCVRDMSAKRADAAAGVS